MISELYLKYKRDTGKEPIISVDSENILDREFIEARDLSKVATSEDEDEYYLCEYVEWLESKLAELT